MKVPEKLTPMLKQYLEIKHNHPNAILFYRMGDFYEMFFEDAIEASEILSITLTSRNNKSDAEKVPMCGVPYHAAQNYIAKLVNAGKRVAICEQTEDPAQAKGIVKREVIRVVSPGVVTDDQLLDDKENRYVCAVVCSEKDTNRKWGISFLDVSTGDFSVGEFEDSESTPESIIDLIGRMNPAELLLPGEDGGQLSTLVDQIRVIIPEICVTQLPDAAPTVSYSHDELCEHFQVINLNGFGCGNYTVGLRSAAVVLEYINDTQKADLAHLESLRPIDLSSTLIIDDASRRNLELIQTLVGAKRDGSLLSVIDRTCTPMGARLLKNQLLFPLQDPQMIKDRLDGVSHLYQNSAIRNAFREALGSIRDIERLNSRMVLGQGNGRDCLAMKESFAKLPEIKNLLAQCKTTNLINIDETFDQLADLHQLLEESINDEPPATLRDGNLIRPGYHAELDDLLTLLRDGKKLILELEHQERERTAIPKLKIGFNKVFGYFIEVSKVNSDKVPEHYIRKQTLVNAERFITPELKEFENKVLNAQEHRLDLEYQLFVEIRSKLAAASHRIIRTAHLLAEIDVYASQAEIARLYHYVRPEITDTDDIEIKEGRHPVIERALPAGKFVPNDVSLDHQNNQVLIITGPNMAGKSTILRQTALIVLMAQMGSFVPAESARIGVVDRIFTRVGAMDDLRRGQSTFMVEMSETANILNNATPRSLVILDEIGRGTSTYDGLSIAWAVTEALVTKDDVGIKTLFATHYHELTDLARKQERVQNYSIAVKEWNETIIFLHKLVPGGTNRSYGIQVAALAGVPGHVVERATEILKKIEQGDSDYQYTNSASGPKTVAQKRPDKKPSQLSLFGAINHPVVEVIANTSIDDLSPRQAIDLLYKLEQMIQKS